AAPSSWLVVDVEPTATQAPRLPQDSEAISARPTGRPPADHVRPWSEETMDAGPAPSEPTATQVPAHETSAMPAISEVRRVLQLSPPSLVRAMWPPAPPATQWRSSRHATP